MYIYHSIFDSVAQLVEQKTLNLWVLGSSPSGVTKERFTIRGPFFMEPSVGVASSVISFSFIRKCDKVKKVVDPIKLLKKAH